MTEQPTLSEEEIRVFESCKTLPPEFAEATDFNAEEAIKLDYSIELPEVALLCELLIEYKFLT